MIILDDVQMLFTAAQPAGRYKTGLENYQRFFQLITDVSHNSCLLLISSEKPPEISNLEKENKPCQALVLGGLGVARQEILKEQNLSDEESWESLIDIYQGNPLWLQQTGTLIKDLCGGRVGEFLQFQMPVICEALAAILDDSFHRLTEEEKAMLYQMAGEEEPVSLGQVFKTMQGSSTALFNVIYSLKSRFWIETIERDKMTFFAVGAVVKAYLKMQR